MTPDCRPQPTSVYRYYDEADRLIYVGITVRGIRRQTEHNGHANWWQFVARQDVEHLASRGEARHLEEQLIRQHRPPFNTQHNDLHELIRAAYMAVRIAEQQLMLLQEGIPVRFPPCHVCPKVRA